MTAAPDRSIAMRSARIVDGSGAPTFDGDSRCPQGIEKVMVNGFVVVKDGKCSGRTPGRLI